MKKAIFLLFLIFLPGYSFSQQGWMQVSPPPGNDAMIDFSFPDSQTGYGVSVGFTVTKTTNAGLSWSVVANLARDVEAIFFVNAETGFVCGDYGRIFKTTNGGYNWDYCLQTGSGFYIQDIFFTDEYTGYACSFGRVYKTIDQGNNWDTLTNGLSDWLFYVHFLDNNTGFVAGDHFLYKTTNGGINWENNSITANAIDFINENTGYLGNNSGLIRKTTNAGLNWISVYLDTLFITEIDVANEDTIYAGCEQGIILKSTNGGANWQRFDLNRVSPVEALYFINGMTGFCSGGINNPYFFYTNTGGTVGITPIGGEVPSSFKLHQNYPNPFNPETKIKIEIPVKLKSDLVRLSIYNSLGQEVAVLINEELLPGNYEYSFNASNFSSGIYFYRLQAGDFTQSKRMILLK